MQVTTLQLGSCCSMTGPTKAGPAFKQVNAGESEAAHEAKSGKHRPFCSSTEVPSPRLEALQECYRSPTSNMFAELSRYIKLARSMSL
jgi:hypothetical protein